MKEGIAYDSRRFAGNSLIFVLNPTKTGDFVLRFQRQDSLRGISYEDLIGVTVTPKPAASPAPGTTATPVPAVASAGATVASGTAVATPVTAAIPGTAAGAAAPALPRTLSRQHRRWRLLSRRRDNDACRRRDHGSCRRDRPSASRRSSSGNSRFITDHSGSGARASAKRARGRTGAGDSRRPGSIDGACSSIRRLSIRGGLRARGYGRGAASGYMEGPRTQRLNEEYQRAYE